MIVADMDQQMCSGGLTPLITAFNRNEIMPGLCITVFCLRVAVRIMDLLVAI